MQRGLLARRWRPSLLVRFGVVSFVLLAAVAVVLAGEVGDLQVERSLDHASARAIATAQIAFLPQLTPGDLARDFAPLDPATIARLDRVARSAMSGGIVRIKIWNPQHRIVYSEDAALIGRSVADDEELVEALEGEITAEVSAPDGEGGSERHFGDLLEVYVPLRVGADGAFTTDATGTVAGVFEIYAPYAPVEAAIAADTRALYAWIAAGFVVLYLGLFRLVLGASRRLRLQAEDNQFQATHDLLTLLPNRRQVVADADRLLGGDRGARSVGLALVGLDEFQDVNDTLGHASGDDVLLTVAARLRDAFHGGDGGEVVGRTGGDEFAVVVPGLEDAPGALAAGQISVAYQPQLDLRTGEVHAVEALVRWHHPVRGLVMPAEFLPIIEGTDLIGPLTWEVLGQSLARCALWRQSGIDLRVAVNVSARTVSDPALVGEVRAALARHGVPANALELELTESAVMGGHASAGAVLAALRALGVRLALDDFGTGYASIGYLTALPLDVLKIDRSFVATMTTESTAAAVVGFTLDLARHLSLEVVAEGIEDAATLEHLRRLGCDVGQGFGIARAMPAEEVGGWVTAWNAAARGARTAPRETTPTLLR